MNKSTFLESCLARWIPKRTRNDLGRPDGEQLLSSQFRKSEKKDVEAKTGSKGTRFAAMSGEKACQEASAISGSPISGPGTLRPGIGAKQTSPLECKKRRKAKFK